MLKKLYLYYASIPSIFIDGLIAISIVFLVFWQDVFGGDEAAKYISAALIFWLKNITGSFAVTLVGLQSFRSKLFAEHLQNKQKIENTQLVKDKNEETVKSNVVS